MREIPNWNDSITWDSFDYLKTFRLSTVSLQLRIFAYFTWENAHSVQSKSFNSSDCLDSQNLFDTGKKKLLFAKLSIFGKEKMESQCTISIQSIANKPLLINLKLEFHNLKLEFYNRTKSVVANWNLLSKFHRQWMLNLIFNQLYHYTHKKKEIHSKILIFARPQHNHKPTF